MLAVAALDLMRVGAQAMNRASARRRSAFLISNP
jgi:hypothetical protein